MYVSTHACMCVFMHAMQCMHVVYRWMYGMYACMHACMYAYGFACDVNMHVMQAPCESTFMYCMHACMYAM